MSSPQQKRIAIFIAFSGEGGVERMVTRLAQGFLDAGYAVDMVLPKAKGEHLKLIPEAARVIKLGSKHTATSLPKLMAYLRREKPDAILAAKHRAMKIAIIARWLTGAKMPLVGRLGTTVSGAMEDQPWIRKALWYRSMRFYYRWMDYIVAVSEGVAEDVVGISKISRDRIGVVRNPVITPNLSRLAAEPVDHPWFKESGGSPIIIGAGRFTRQKDFDTLIRAFAKLRQQRAARLLILGEGKLRPNLEALVAELGLQQDVDLPGFADNPYAYMAKAQLFVLSSRWEGSPNVLTEALALGIPSVSTDCPSGPLEILADGRYGPLVTMGDIDGLAAAMAATLEHPLPAETLREAVQAYRQEISAQGYLQALGLTDAATTVA